MSFTYISYVGNQTEGIVSSIETCLAAKDDKEQQLFDIQKIFFLYSEATKEHALNLAETYKNKNFYVDTVLSTRESSKETLINASKNSRVIFNLSGGQNFQVALTICENHNNIDYFVTTDRNKIIVINLSKEYSVKTIPIEKLKSADELLSVHDYKAIPEKSSSPLCEFLRLNNIRLPEGEIRDGALENVNINGIHYDLVWNDGSNRLAFLTDFTEKSQNKEERQHLTRTACSKQGKGLQDLFDRGWYVICGSATDIQHIKFESRGKITTYKRYGHFSGDQFKTGFKPDPKEKIQRKNPTEELSEFLKKIFLNKPNESFKKKTVSVESDTLIIALGNDITVTLNAVLTHKKEHNIKNVIMLATSYDPLIKEYSEAVQKYFNEKGLNTTIFKTDINASNIIQGVIKKENAENVLVNVTPGSKGQGAALSYWSVLNGADAWSIETSHSQLKCINNPSKEGKNFGVIACDIRDYFKILYPFKKELFEEDTEKDKKFMSLLLEQMRCCIKDNVEWNKLSVKGESLSSGNITLKLDQSIIYKSGENYCKKGKYSITDDKGNTYFYRFDGGDWFESLTAQALREAGCQFVYARTRLPFEEKLQNKMQGWFENDVFRIDMDAIASFHGVHFLVSCKSQTLGDKKANPIDEVAREAQDVAASINRFCVPVVCYLNKNNKDEFILPEDKKKKAIPIIDWKELCQPAKLRDILENARRSYSTNNKRIQTVKADKKDCSE